MMGLSNLPPGCTSDDGGIDHAFVNAVERLEEEAETVDVLVALKLLCPAIKEIMRESFEAGRQDMRMEYQSLTGDE